ncbi:MAG: tRNA (cytidine(34)-2'-O)-methyltransferase [Hyphomicrobiales bacterium]
MLKKRHRIHHRICSASTLVSLALFQPEIPANTGTLMRLSACLNVPLHVIGPTGFSMDDRALRRAGMDYRDKALTHVHVDFDAFCRANAWTAPRLIVMTTKASMTYTDFSFQKSDMIVMGRETAGAPGWLHERADARLIIPMAVGTRSLNMAVSASLVVGEALRQTNDFPETLSHTAAPETSGIGSPIKGSH